MKKRRSNKIIRAYETCLSGLPSTYPRPFLLIYETTAEMVDDLMLNGYDCSHLDTSANDYALADAQRDQILISEEMARFPHDEILEILLHEFGHFYYAAKHGASSDQFFNESLADKFATNWKKRILAK